MTIKKYESQIIAEADELVSEKKIYGYAFFNLDAKYTEIIGMIGHIDGSGNDDMTLTITGDGVLIKTIEIGFNNLTNELSIPVTGVKQLKIEVSRSSATVGFADLTIH